MGTANINDRRSLERLYPLKAFARDTAQNERQTAEVLNGVLVASAPDASGSFAMSRMARHTGEPPSPDFLVPLHHVPPNGGAQTAPDLQRLYAAFLDEIVETAKQRGYRSEESPGRGDARIRGLRQ